MKMKKKLSVLLCFILSVVMVGCNAKAPIPEASPSPSEAGAEKESLSLGLISSISALPIIMAEEKGYFEEAGVDVKLEFLKLLKIVMQRFKQAKLMGSFVIRLPLLFIKMQGLI